MRNVCLLARFSALMTARLYTWFCSAFASDLASGTKPPRRFDVHLLHDGRLRHQMVCLDTHKLLRS